MIESQIISLVIGYGLFIIIINTIRLVDWIDYSCAVLCLWFVSRDFGTLLEIKQVASEQIALVALLVPVGRVALEVGSVQLMQLARLAAATAPLD